MLLVHRPRLEQQSPGAGCAERFCKGPGSTFPGFVGPGLLQLLSSVAVTQTWPWANVNE